MIPLRQVGFTAVVLGGVAACSSSTRTTVDPPSAGTYTLDFPSVAAAVASDSVRVRIYEAADASDQCLSLVALVQAGEEPTAVAAFDTGTLLLCDGDGGVSGGALAIPFGTYAVLGTAQRDGADFLLGCQLKTVSLRQPSFTVDLTLNDDAVPATSCTSLAERCANTCSDGGG